MEGQAKVSSALEARYQIDFLQGATFKACRLSPAADTESLGPAILMSA